MHTTATTNHIRTCCHIFPASAGKDHDRCGSPALRNEPFCYFHKRLHKDHPTPLTAQQIMDTWSEGSKEAYIGGGEDPYLIARTYPCQNEFNFPPLEDAESMGQSSVADVNQQACCSS